MNPIPLIPQSEANYKLYYIVPLVFVYIFHQIGGGYNLVFALIALLGAASRHGIGEALYGPGGEEKSELSEVKEIRRLGTLIHRDKEPSEYSANSSREMLEEGEMQSKFWVAIVAALGIFQFLFSVMFLIAVYSLYRYRFELDFVGGVLLFTLVALIVYGVIRELLPDISQIDKFDHEIQELSEDFIILLNSENISITNLVYEPAEGGAFRIDCEVNYEYSKGVSEDINRIAVSFCSFVSRSSYPISHGEISLTTTDDIIIDFEIDPIWCSQLLNGQISSEHYSELIERTASVSGTDNVDSLF
ncbi:hypothetical protein [Natrinema versiforme]|uniref:hypothetical protein n=1 Tax=Natrinema versiforme TaxID=88724 RepID=UPI001268EBE2|nr:hypothetical protein [Natrinema versiforme]